MSGIVIRNRFSVAPGRGGWFRLQAIQVEKGEANVTIASNLYAYGESKYFS